MKLIKSHKKQNSKKFSTLERYWKGCGTFLKTWYSISNVRMLQNEFSVLEWGCQFNSKHFFSNHKGLNLKTFKELAGTLTKELPGSSKWLQSYLIGRESQPRWVLWRVVTRMGTSKSGWTPSVYYTTPRYTIFRRNLLDTRTLKKVGKSE